MRTKTPASDAHYSGLTQPKRRDWKGSTPTSSTAHRSPQQGWLGEVAAIETTLAATEQKLHAARQLGARPTAIANLGMPVAAGETMRPPVTRDAPKRLGHLSKIVD